MSVLRDLSETFYVGRGEVINPKRRKKYKFVLWVVVAVHFVGFWLAIAAVFWSKALFNVAIVTPEILAVCSLLQLVTLTSALFIFFLSLRSEVLVSQAHELTVALTPTFSLAFGPDGPAAFQDHIAWLKDNLSPDKFPGQPTVAFTVSNRKRLANGVLIRGNVCYRGIQLLSGGSERLPVMRQQFT